jgi:methylglutaconyl-CoA hydratase
MARQLSYAADPRVRVVLLGADQSPFCSGWDVRDLAGLDTASRDDVAAYFEAGRELLRAIEGCPVPLVAAVSGVALGFGCSILAHCDLVIADRGATFGLPEVKRGFPPATVMPELLEAMDARVVGAWALTGARHDAGQARSAGLVDRVAETSALSAVVSEVLAELTSTDTAVLRQTKALLRALQARNLPQRRELGVAAATDHFCK